MSELMPKKPESSLFLWLARKVEQEVLYEQSLFSPRIKRSLNSPGLVHAVAIGEQGIGDRTHIEQAIPICIAPRQAPDLKPKKDSHSSLLSRDPPRIRN